jgi:hypothetical protein
MERSGTKFRLRVRLEELGAALLITGAMRVAWARIDPSSTASWIGIIAGSSVYLTRNFAATSRRSREAGRPRVVLAVLVEISIIALAFVPVGEDQWPILWAPGLALILASYALELAPALRRRFGATETAVDEEGSAH